VSAPVTGGAPPTRPGPTTRDPAHVPLLLTLAAVVLSHALQISDGHFQVAALRWLTLTLLACVAAFALPRRWGRRLPPQALPVALGLGLAAQFVQLARQPPGIYPDIVWPDAYAPYVVGLGIAAALVVAGLADARRLRRVWFPALLLVQLALGAWVIRHAPAPPIDVFVFQQEGSAALLRGENPYTLTFPNIYGDGAYYGPGLDHDGRLAFGFPYPPLSLFLALPSYLLAGDHRYAQLLALALAGALLALARPGRVGALAAALLLFSPRVFFVLEQGWTEPFLILLLALVVACACRWPRALPVAFGLLLAVKQTLVFAPLTAFLLVGEVVGGVVGSRGRWRDWWRLVWRAGGVALAISLPLALWNVRGFVVSVVTLQLYQPLRPDALSYVAWLARANLPAPGWLAFAAIVPACALALWRGARTPAGFAAAMALIYLTFFAFNKQAFCNYYFFALGALCAAIAATHPVASPSLGPRSQTNAVNSATVTRS